MKRKLHFYELVIGPVEVFGSKRVLKSSNLVMECFKASYRDEDLSMRVMFLSNDLRGALKETWNTTMPQIPGGIEYVPAPPPPEPKSSPTN